MIPSRRDTTATCRPTTTGRRPRWVPLWIRCLPLLLLPQATHWGADGGGVLRVAFTSDPITLDPHKSTTIWEFLTQPLLHLTLLDIHGTTHLEPRGAASWTSSPDGRHFRFRLRPGLTFSNGRPVVAADYVYGLERILAPATATFFQGSLLGVKGSKAFIEGTSPHVDGLKAPAPDLLVIELDQGDPMFGYQLAQLAYPLPREVVDRDPQGFGRQPVGAGPYRVARWDRGARLRLERRPDYRGPDPALVDAVDIFIGSDATTHLMMFEQGEIDIANVVSQSLPFPSYRRVSTDPHWKDLIEIQPGLSTEFIAMTWKSRPSTTCWYDAPSTTPLTGTAACRCRRVTSPMRQASCPNPSRGTIRPCEDMPSTRRRPAISWRRAAWRCPCGRNFGTMPPIRTGSVPRDSNGTSTRSASRSP